jgi:hypothetical protein
VDVIRVLASGIRATQLLHGRYRATTTGLAETRRQRGQKCHYRAVAYDDELANRLRDALAAQSGLTERAMFGGLAFLIDGALAVSASSRGGLLLRVDPTEATDLLSRPEAAPFVMRGRAMTGWLHIDTADLSEREGRHRSRCWPGWMAPTLTTTHFASHPVHTAANGVRDICATCGDARA